MRKHAMDELNNGMEQRERRTETSPCDKERKWTGKKEQCQGPKGPKMSANICVFGVPEENEGRDWDSNRRNEG